MKFSLGYPTLDEESHLLALLQKAHPLDSLEPVATAAELVACQQAVRAVHFDEKVRRYIAEIVHATRQCDELALGASPRASIALFRTGQAMAALRGRNYVLPDDIKRVVGPVVAHRLILKPEYRLRGGDAGAILAEVVADVRVPILEEGSGVR